MGSEVRQGYETIEAEFFSLIVYEVRGFTLREDETATESLELGGAACVIGVGGGVNELSRSIAGDEYCEDETAWAKEKGASPPYVLVRIGPTARHVAKHPRSQPDGEKTVTFEAFQPAKTELAALEAAAQPLLESALFGVFGENKSVVFRPTDKVVFGLTPEGGVVVDLTLRITASGYASTSLEKGEVGRALGRVSREAQRLSAQQVKFLQAGLRAEDGEKKFLYLFIAVEREVHRSFKSISPAEHIRRGMSTPGRLGDSLSALLQERLGWGNVADRFVWCVSSFWESFGPDEIDEFKRLKRLRDGIAHGSGPEPTASDVSALLRLARRVFFENEAGPQIGRPASMQTAP